MAGHQGLSRPCASGRASRALGEELALYTEEGAHKSGVGTNELSHFRRSRADIAANRHAPWHVGFARRAEIPPDQGVAAIAPEAGVLP